MSKNKKEASPKIGIIILAAGASKRMGQPKQLLKIDGQTLIERAIAMIQPIKQQHSVVVLGANAIKIQPFIKPFSKVKVMLNQNWELGMGTTLSTGMNYFLSKKIELAGVIALVCDQPYLTTEKLEELIAVFQKTQADIVATTYNNILGVPALFSKKLFPRLAQLKKDEGARKIIKTFEGKIVSVPFPNGIYDLDTPEAYAAFLKRADKNVKK